MKTMLAALSILAVTMLVPRTWADDAGKPPACYDNLCGGDSYCSCHEATGGLGRRCWTTQLDCKVDLKCCLAGHCAGMVEDACTATVRAERKKREKK
jgi:hypothetical protein